MMKPVGSRLCQIAESEGDTNLTTQRAEWQARRIDPATKALLARDEAAFPSPVRIYAMPQRRRQGGRDLD